MGNNKFMWIRLQKNVEPNWKCFESAALDAKVPGKKSRVDSRIFNTNVDYEPDFKGENSIDYDSECIFYHRKLNFTVALSLKDVMDSSSDLELRVVYTSINGSDAYDFVEDWNEKNSGGKSKYMHECNAEEGWYRDPDGEPCKQYFWAFEQCLIKLNFVDENKSCVFSKRLSMSYKGWEKEATTETSLISGDELKKHFNYDSKQGKKGFLSVVIEISARLFLDCLKEGQEESEYQIKCKESVTKPADNAESGSFVSKPPASKNASVSNKRIRLSTGMHFDKFKLTPDSGDCDLIVEIGSDGLQNISVHKAVLAVKSPVFRAMFGKGWQEFEKLKLEDHTFAGVKAFVEYLYDSSADIDSLWDLKLCMEVLKLAHFYQIMDLIDYCVDNIMLTSYNSYDLTLALEMFQGGQLFHLPDLSDRASQWIKTSKDGMNAHDKKQLEDFIASFDDKDKISCFI